MPSAAEIRAQQRQTWNAFSEGWAKWDRLTLSMLWPVGDEMIRELDPSDEGEHLEGAAGAGEPGLTIAARMPGGRVVLTDISAGMLATAAAHAKTRGLTNVEVQEAGVEDLPFADASFDTIGCRFGLMFVPDVPAAVREMARVLRPGGRISVAVWAEPSSNPWATIPMAAIAAEIELAPPDPDAPGLFRCAAPGAIAAIFGAAGLHDVSEHDVEGHLEPANFEEYWDYITEVAAAVVAGLTRADPPARARIKHSTLAQAEAYTENGRPSIPLLARCIVGTK